MPADKVRHHHPDLGRLVSSPMVPLLASWLLGAMQFRGVENLTRVRDVEADPPDSFVVVLAGGTRLRVTVTDVTAVGEEG